MSNPKFRTPYNSIYSSKRYEFPSAISQTVPDDTLTIREIVDRFARGLPITGTSREPVYNGEDDYFPDFKSMDLAEVEEWKANADLNVHNLKMQLKEAAAAAKAKAKADAVAVAKAELLKQRQNEASQTTS